MSTIDELKDSLESFAQSCNANARLLAMIKDWNRKIHVHATDLAADFLLTTLPGSVAVAPGAGDAPDMVIQSTSDILTEVFFGEVSPNEPYNEGTLRIQGREDDIVRLDFVIAMLWE
jgi:hypothetical protein